MRGCNISPLSFIALNQYFAIGLLTLGFGPKNRVMEKRTTPRPADDGQGNHLPASASSARHSAIVPIREIGERYRPQVLQHLLSLGEHDRYLRFGFAANDWQIENYVDKLNFRRDQVFGIFNRKLELIAMAHLAYPEDFATAGFAEFGVSVAPHARGRGYGSRLFDRAAIHAVNDDVKTLYIHALTENTAMLKIARKAGAVIERSGSESEAHLKLPEATFKSRVSELLAGQVGQVDYWLKSESRSLRGLIATAQEVRDAVRDSSSHRSGT
jgi:RimJ/RimL family protein N-acetyltransferase